MKNILIAAVAAFFPFIASAQSSGPDVARGEHADKIDAIFAQYSDETPGCAVAVDHHGAFVHLAGYGMADLEQSVEIRPDTVFYAGSVSKQVVGMAAMLLDHEGRIDLDAPVSAYLPQLPAYADDVTVRQTLHHTSGIRDFFVLFHLAGEPDNYVITEDAIMAMLARQNGLNFEPGSEYAYSNSAYFLISQIAKAVTGADLDVFAQKRIFAPLGMESSRFQHNHRRLLKRKAHGYEPQENGEYLLADSTLDVVGSGGMYTSVIDLMRWDRNFYDNALGGGPALIDEMQTSGILNSGEATDYGIALSLKPYRGLTRVSHSGTLAGYRAHLARFPDERFSVALLCNSSEAKPKAHAEAIADIFLEGKMSAPEETDEEKDSSEKRDDNVSKRERAAYEGAYYSREVGNTIIISDTDEGLVLAGVAGDDHRLTPIGKDAFRHSGRDFDLSFSRGQDGAVPSFTVSSERASGIVFERAE